MTRTLPIAAALALALSSPAAATPGLGEKVYGATVEAGVSEVEARYGRLTGGAADGGDALVVELSHGLNDRLYGGVLFELEREAGGRRALREIGAEAVVALGRIDALGLDIALYAEYAAVRGGTDAAETKLLLQHRRGAFDGRLNLIVEKELAHGEPLEFGYAASADWRIAGDFRLGVAAFGNLGTTRRPFGRDEHFAGPVAKAEIEHLPGKGELGIEAGYLFALGAARDHADGQARLLLEYEFRF